MSFLSAKDKISIALTVGRILSNFRGRENYFSELFFSEACSEIMVLENDATTALLVKKIDRGHKRVSLFQHLRILYAL